MSITNGKAVAPVSPFAGRRIHNYQRPFAHWVFHPALREGTFNARYDVPAMLQDHAVQMGMWAIYGSLDNAQFEVRANNKDGKRFIENTIYRFWNHDRAKVVQHYVPYGTCAGEPMYEKDADTGLWNYAGLDDFDIGDVQPWKRGRQMTKMRVSSAGMGLGGDFQEENLSEWNVLRHPKIFWCAHKGLCGNLRGHSSLEASWNPWMEKCGSHGAKSNRKLWAFSNSFRGCIVKYPVGSTLRADGMTRIDNRDIAQEIAENYSTGGVSYLPSGVDENGTPLWEIIDPKINGDFSELLNYPTQLDREIWQGMGVPDEILHAPETGGIGPVSREGPYSIFISISDFRVRELITAFDVGPSGYTTRSEQAGGVLRPLCMENFGPKFKYEIRPISLAPKPAEPGAGGSPQSAPAAATGNPGMPPKQSGAPPVQLSSANAGEVELPDDEVADILDEDVQLSAIHVKQLAPKPPNQQAKPVAKHDIAPCDTEDLANLYAHLWQGQHPDKIGQDELATVHEELGHGEHHLCWDDEHGWSVRHTSESDDVQLSTHHAPKGGIVINGKAFKGGMFIPSADYQAATPEEKAAIDNPKQASEDARRARGSVDHDALKEKLEPHAHHEMTAQEKTSAKRSFNALYRHHGDLTLHRLEEIADQLQAAHDREGNTEGQTEQYSRRLRAVQHQIELAKANGVTGDVTKPESFFKAPAEQQGLYSWNTPELKSDATSAPTMTEQPNEQPNAETAEERTSGRTPAADRGGDSDRSAGGDDGGRGNRPDVPRIITVREQHTKPSNPALVPQALRGHLNEAQQHGTSLAIESMEKHGGFLLADGTGVGKTRQELAVAKHFADKGKKVIVVSPSEVIKPNWKKGTMAGSFAHDSATMGVDAKLIKGDGDIASGGIHLTTYNELGKLKDKIDKDTVVIFDESHFMKNRSSARYKHGKDIIDKAGSVMYATATPADKPLHIAHLAKANVFGNAGQSETYQKLGMKLVDQHIGGGQTVKCWQIDPKVGFKEAARRLSGLFDQMTKDGLMIKRELSMDRVNVGMDRLELDDSQHAEIQKVFDDKMSETNGNKAVSLMAARLHQEPFKIPHTVKAIQEELAAGRMPVVFVGRVNDIGEENDEGETEVESVGTAPALKAALIAAGVPESDIGELHGGATKTAEQKKKAMEDFQSGKRKVMIATIQSGGTGINLDDTTGKNPRSLIMMTPPFTANDMAQALGRVNRLNTKSDVRVRGILANTSIDDWNAGILENKFKTLGAVVGGNAKRGMEAIRPDAAVANDEGEAFDWGESLHPIPKVYHNTPFSHNDIVGQFGGRRTQKNGEWTTQFPSQEKLDAYKAHVAPKEQSKAQEGSTPTVAPKATPAELISVSGNTYAHKDKIKSAGGKWDSGRGVWTISPDAKEKIAHLNGLRFSGGESKPEEAKPKISDDQRKAIHEAVRILAGNDPDRARERNGVGFNQMDANFGASLAEASTLTDKQAEAAAKMLAKYHRQLPEDLHKKATESISLSSADAPKLGGSSKDRRKARRAAERGEA